MSQIMLINVVEPEETRIAILEDNQLEEFYLERATQERIVGNIYKGVVTNIQPSLEAAFVDFGRRKHGFLHASDVRNDAAQQDSGKRNGSGTTQGDISQLLQEGQHILVQVTKEGIGDKGPALTTYLSLPGRCLVLMPGLSRRGVSRRIVQEPERQRLRNLIKDLKIPSGIGIIARTASEDSSHKDLERDLDYLVKLWTVVEARARKSDAPALIYQESDQVIRAIRDVFTDEISKIVVDSPEVFERAREFLNLVMPGHVRKVRLHKDHQALFHKYGVEAEIEKMGSRTAALKSGGSIVLEQTEALVAIDVNSGHFKGKADAEETAYRINMDAAPEIARQVRLRDLGGLLIIDFIDMQDGKHRAEVEDTLWKALKKDRARFRMLRMSPFCIVEITRQRRRVSFGQTAYVDCPSCGGKGRVKSAETVGLEIMRKLRTHLAQPDIQSVEVHASPSVANYVNNAMRSRLEQLQGASGGKRIAVVADIAVGQEQHDIRFLKENGSRMSV